MLKTVEEIIYSVTGKRNITNDTDFIRDLELNSFDIMNIVCAFEERFQITIPTRDVWKIHQVRDAVQYLEERGVSPFPEGEAKR